MTPGEVSPEIALAALPAAAVETLRRLAAVLPPGAAAWLVGGAVRDVLEGTAAADLDVAVAGDAVATARALAAATARPFVLLDPARGAARVAGPVSVDFTPLRGGTLADDARGRDVTVNALAVALAPLLAQGCAAVEDPLGGLADLRSQLVRLCAPDAIAGDPVRALRVVRLAMRPGWRLDPAVAPAVRAAAAGLAGVAAERVREELRAVLAGATAGVGVRLLDELGVLAVLFPERAAMRATAQPLPHRFDVWEHSVRALESAAELRERVGELGEPGPALAAHLAEPIGDGWRRADLLLLAALLHDVAKPETRAEIEGRVRFFGHDVLGAERAQSIADRLRLSGRAAGVLTRLVRQHLRPMHLVQAGGVTRRARYRFQRDLGEDAMDLLLLAAADGAAVRGDPPVANWLGPGGDLLRDLLGGLQEARASVAAPALVRGEDVMAAFGLTPGPAVGRLLAVAREAQATGLVTTREEALALLRDRGLLDTSGKPP